MVSVLLGWGITAFLALALVGSIAVISSSEVLTPVGLSGFKCYGFYNKCSLDLCISVDQYVASAPYDALPPLHTWRSCSLNDTVKLEAKACVFDEALYKQSQRLYGYDVCESEFEDGVYVFEDSFEYWGNKTSFKSNRSESYHIFKSIRICVTYVFPRSEKLKMANNDKCFGGRSLWDSSW